MLSRFERRLVTVVVLLAVALLAGVVVVLVRWGYIKAWLDAPEVLRVNAAALEVPLPGDAEDDPTRSACPIGAMRCGWVDAAPADAVAAIADGLRARDVEADAVLCEDPALPPGPRGGRFACGARVVAADEELWVLATDRTPTGGVAFPRTAVWFAWSTTDLSWPMYERIAEADPYPYPYAPGVDEPAPAAAAEIGPVLPERYAGVLEHCWAWLSDTADAPCTVWEAPLTAHRFTGPGGWTGATVAVRRDGDGLVARVMAL